MTAVVAVRRANPLPSGDGAVKGAFLAAFPGTLLSLPTDATGAVGVFRVVYVLFALLGLYLTWVGWGRGDREG